jgi:exosortase H (IPTLxxWG-CTERM-specific)
VRKAPANALGIRQFPWSIATRAQRAELQLVRFFILFFVYLGSGALVMQADTVKREFVEPWTRLNASAAAIITGRPGVDVESTGVSVGMGGARLTILPGCNGVEAVLILIASILAFPSSWSRRLVGVPIAAAAIFGFNIVRLATLIAVARYLPARLEFFHVYVWQPLIVLIAFCLFLVWARYATLERTRKSTADRA